MTPITYSGRSAVLSDERHEEWLLDDAIDDTFPASDPVSHGQPGSIVNMRYTALESRTPRRLSSVRNKTSWWLLAGSVAVCALLLARYRRRPR